MIKFIYLILLTLRETLAKKIFVVFFVLSTLLCLLLLFAINLQVVEGMQSAISVFGVDLGHTINLNKLIHGIEGLISVLLFSGGIFLSLFACSNLITSLMEPGYIDLFISKPLSRWQILLGRYLGSIAVVAINIFYLILFSALIIAFKTHIWNWGFLTAGLLIVFTFAVLFTLMMFINVIGGNGPIALMVTYFIIFFSPLLVQRDQIYALLNARFYGYLLDGLYYILPKMAQLGFMTQQVVRGAEIGSWMPLWSTLLFGVAMLGISIVIFKRKNF